jgi:hypothetical protein
LYHFLDLALVNSFILYKEKEQLPLFEFKLDVAVSLMYGEVFDSPMAIGAIMLRQAAVAGFAENGDPIGSEVHCRKSRLELFSPSKIFGLFLEPAIRNTLKIFTSRYLTNYFI